MRSAFKEAFCFYQKIFAGEWIDEFLQPCYMVYVNDYNQTVNQTFDEQGSTGIGQ